MQRHSSCNSSRLTIIAVLLLISWIEPIRTQPSTQAPPTDKLLVVDASHVTETDSRGSVIKYLMKIEDISDMDFDHTTGYLYWTNRTGQSIQRAYIIGEDPEHVHVEDVITTGLEYPAGICGDWTNHKLYWTDTGAQRIESSNLDGSDRRVLAAELNTPVSITMDTRTQTLFWVDQGTVMVSAYEGVTWRDVTIEQLDPNTGTRHVLLSDNLQHPVSLFYSPENVLLFWCDDARKVIEACPVQQCSWKRNRHIKPSTYYNNTEGKSVVAINKPGSITVSDSALYWTEPELNIVMMKNLTTREISAVPNTAFIRPTRIHTYNTTLPTGSLPCEINNGGCPQLCIGSNGASWCGCYAGYQLKSTSADNKTCVDVDECLQANNSSLCAGPAAVCTNIPGSYRCECDEGYVTDENNECTDADECRTNAHGCEHICTNIPASYRCTCYQGFQLDADAKSCKDVNECLTTPNPCEHACDNIPGSYRCTCGDNHRPTEGGHCDVITCAAHVPIIDGYIIQCAVVEGAGHICNLMCEQGTLVGDDIIECNEAGQWVFPESVCRVDMNTEPQLYLWPPGITENTRPNTTVGQLTLRDDNTTVVAANYEIEGPSPFTVEHNGSAWNLVVQGNLDFESNDHITLTLDVIYQVHDDALAVHVLQLTVDIYDVNEPPSPPSIDRKSIAEDAQIRDTVGVFQATDPDNAQTLRYHLLRQVDAFGYPSTKFQVDYGTTLALYERLDYERSAYYSIVVQAIDNGYPQRSSTSTIKINVLDVNERANSLNLTNNVIEEYTGSNQSDTNHGYVIGSITVDDPDDPWTENYTLSIMQVDWQTLTCFEIKQIERDSTGHEQFELLVDNPRCFDYESFTNQTAYIKVEDEGGPLFKESLLVMINNLNEPPNRIIFTAHYVMEHAPLDYPIGELMAMDPDSTPDRIQLTISSHGDLVRLDSGMTVVVNADYDYDVTPSFTFTARATDMDTGLYMEQIHTITVRAEPRKPRITAAINGEYACIDDVTAICVAENTTVGKYVASVFVTLPGGGSSYVLEVSDSSGHFQRVGSQIRLAKELNYESGLHHITLNVRATDHNQQSTFMVINVKVFDTNDGPKEVLLSNTLLPTRVEVGHVVGELTCVDEDSWDTYTFGITDPSGRFIIDGTQLKVDKPLDYAIDEYLIAVYCTDAAYASATSHFVIVHAIGDGTEIVVTITGDTISEHAPNGTGIANITAHISYQPSNAVIFDFTLENQQYLPFTLNLTSNIQAELRKDGNLSYDLHPWYNVVIKITDLAHAKGVKFVNLTIGVLNVHQHPSDMWLSRDSIEEGPAGRELLIVSLFNYEPATTYSFSLKQHDIDEPHILSTKLAISTFENTNAKLVALEEIDYETLGPRHTLSIKASDAYLPQIYIEKEFNITLLNINERPTAIRLQGGETASIVENSRAGSQVDKLIVEDPDSLGVNNRPVFTCDVIHEPYGAWFYVDRDLNLRVFSMINFEEIRHRTIGAASVEVAVGIDCADEGGLTVNQSVTIQIVNVNERPVDIISHGEKYLLENGHKEEMVDQFYARDPDLNDDATFRVSGDYTNLPFEFRGNALYRTEPLNFESVANWTLEITATDKGNLSITKPYTVHVVDINDPPTDIMMPRGVAVHEGWSAGTPVAPIYIADEDPSPFRLHSCLIMYQVPADALKITDESLLQVNKADVIDYERYLSINVTIECTDTGLPPLGIHKTFSIPIIDNSNEAKPMVTVEPNTIPEHFSTRGIIGVLKVKDSNGNLLAPADYSVAQIYDSTSTDERALGIKYNRTFRVYQVYVVNSNKLSYEDSTTVIVNLSVTLYTTIRATQFNTTVTIHLTDVMETPRKVIFYPTPALPPGVTTATLLAQGPYTGTVLLNVAESTGIDNPNRIVYYFYVVDEDILNGRTLNYDITITTGQRTKRHAIDKRASTPQSNEGFYANRINNTNWFELVAAINIDFETKANYELYVVVKDTASNQAPLVQKFIIMLTDVKEAPYNVTLSNQHIAENSPPGTLVGQIILHDQDVSPNGYTYRVADSTVPFYIVNNNIYVGYTVLNYETVSEYTLMLNISENNPSYAISKLFQIKIYVDDVAEPPCCLALYPGGTTYVTIPVHGLTLNYSIGYLGVMDEDTSDVNHTFEFKIFSGRGDTLVRWAFSIVTGNHLVLSHVPSSYLLSSGSIYQLKISTYDSTGLRYDGSIFVQFSDTCGVDLCSINAFCDTSGEQGVCRCKPGYTGDGSSCDLSTSCSSMPCQNGGSCYHSETDISYICKCAPPYAGVHCEADMSVCNNIACPYNGYCLPDTRVGYECRCDVPYSTNCTKCISNNRLIDNNCTVIKAQVLPHSGSENRRILTGVIAGAIALTLVLVIILLIVCFVRRQKNKSQSSRVRYTRNDGEITVEPHDVDSPNQFENPLYSSVSKQTNYKYVNQGTQHFSKTSKEKRASGKNAQAEKPSNASTAEPTPPLTDMEKTLSAQEEITL